MSPIIRSQSSQHIPIILLTQPMARTLQSRLIPCIPRTRLILRKLHILPTQQCTTRTQLRNAKDKMKNWTGTEQIHMSTTPVVGTTEPASILISFPPDWAPLAGVSLLPPLFGQEKRLGYLTPPGDSREPTASGPLPADPATVPHFLPTDNWLGRPHAARTFTSTTGTSVEIITLPIATPTRKSPLVRERDSDI
jgi:hypothetical protein